MSEAITDSNDISGKVYIVGAGAGSLDYLTVKAYKLISEAADIVIYDRLISEDIIDAINPSAQKIFAGKEPKLHHMTQDEINDAIVEYSQKGKIVVRLKGGDPFIFGRGGEEIEALEKHNIRFEVIPGITSASVAASQLNLPLTYRNIADGVIFVSGHSYKDQEPKLNWQHLSTGDNTIVIYMGVGNIAKICANLIRSDMDENTPCAVIQNAGGDNSRYLKASLKNLPDEITSNNIKNPAIIVIGEVVNKSLMLALEQ